MPDNFVTLILWLWISIGIIQKTLLGDYWGKLSTYQSY